MASDVLRLIWITRGPHSRQSRVRHIYIYIYIYTIIVYLYASDEKRSTSPRSWRHRQ